MTWPTHALFGISTLWLLTPLPPEVIGYDMGTLAAIGYEMQVSGTMAY